MKIPNTIRWVHRYGSLYVEQHDSLDDAVRSAEYETDHGESSTDCIEGPHGVLSDEMWDGIKERLDREDRERRAEGPQRPPIAHRIDILHPDPSTGAARESDWAPWAHFTDEEDQLEEMGWTRVNLTLRYGTARVRIVDLRR